MMASMFRVGIVVVLALGCANAGKSPPPVLDALFPDGRRTETLGALADSETLGADEAFRLREIGRDAFSSHHVVWIREREVPHTHDRHDLWVVMLRGHGTMRLGDEERPVGEGSVLYVPRGTVHAFRNLSDEVAVAYAVYAPAFDGRDRVDVE
jgi:mannose-6-phosphate isomerase-like protein (cupin superfamily)